LGKGRKRILLVDDEPDNVRIFTIALRDAGFEVDAFVDPGLALSTFKPNYYDLLILDMRMRDMPGDQLYQKLKKIDDKFKVCVLSAYGSEEYKSRFSPDKSANGISYIAKPVSLDELVAKVNEIINR
jgi:DNA-binding response OmpR family regulator